MCFCPTSVAFVPTPEAFWNKPSAFLSGSYTRNLQLLDPCARPLLPNIRCSFTNPKRSLEQTGRAYLLKKTHLKPSKEHAERGTTWFVSWYPSFLTPLGFRTASKQERYQKVHSQSTRQPSKSVILNLEGAAAAAALCFPCSQTREAFHQHDARVSTANFCHVYIARSCDSGEHCRFVPARLAPSDIRTVAICIYE